MAHPQSHVHFSQPNVPNSERGIRTNISRLIVANEHLDRQMGVSPPFGSRRTAEVLNKKEAKLKFINAVHNAMLQKFNADGVILVLMASINFMGILQPPGGFETDGDMSYLKPPLLVGCFLLFSTLSFLMACTGLLAVVAGTASMFRPGFYLNTDLKFAKVDLSEPSEDGPEFSEDGPAERPESIKGGSDPTKLDGFTLSEFYRQKSGNDAKDADQLDDPKVLAYLVGRNLHRAWRLRLYLVASLGSCVVAFVCGALAIIQWNVDRNRWFLVGALVVGGVFMVVEVCKSGTGLTSYYSGRWNHTLHQIPMLSIAEMHPHTQCVSRVLRNFVDTPTQKSGAARAVLNPHQQADGHGATGPSTHRASGPQDPDKGLHNIVPNGTESNRSRLRHQSDQV